MAHDLTTYFARTFDEACDLCHLFDETFPVWFENEGLEVRVRTDDLTEEMDQAAIKILMRDHHIPSNQTGLSGCGVHSFYVD